jgi:uncharacterized membrane protein
LNPALAQVLRSLQRNILAGLITIAPLFVTYLIFSFLLGILAKAGLPVIWVLAYFFPDSRFNEAWFQPVLAVLLALVVLYVLGRATSQFAGKKVFELFEAALNRLPVVAKIYSSVRQLVDNMTAKKEGGQRVVLVEFPIVGQRCIGFLSRTMTDSVTGETVAAVLLPNAINPTSAFLQLLPMHKVIETDVTMEHAMSMLLTGGAVGPDVLKFYNPSAPVPGTNTPQEIVTVNIEETEINVIVPAEDGAAAAAAGEQRRSVTGADKSAGPAEFPPADRPAR